MNKLLTLVIPAYRSEKLVLSHLKNLHKKYKIIIIENSYDKSLKRKIENKYCIFNTPVYENDYSKKVVLNNIFLIYHNKQNVSKKLMGVEAIPRFMAFCIQHNYDEKIINKMLNVISDITNKIPIHELGFLPDSSVIQYLKENHFE